MIRKINTLLLSLFITIPAFCYSVSDKIELEKVYADRLERVLENMIGKDKVMVYVYLELDSVQKQEQRETYLSQGSAAAAGPTKWLFEQNKTNTQYYLPGYPVEQNNPAAASPERVQRLVEQTIEVPGTVVKRADVTILVEPGVKEEALKTVPRLTAGLLNLNKDRGDTISIRRIPFTPSVPLTEQFKKPEIIMEMGKYMVISVILLISIFIFLLLSKSFLNNVAVIVQAIRPKLEVAVAQKSTENIVHTGEIKSAGAMTVEGKRMPAGIFGAEVSAAAETRVSTGDSRRFAFVQENNLKKMSTLIKNETADSIALAISYLNPKDASFILSTLEPSKRAAVTNKLLNTIEATPEAVDQVEKSLKNKIDYVLGGNEFVLEMLDFADNSTREALLSDVSSQNIHAAEQLRSELFLFSDLEHLKDLELKRIIDNIDNETLAVAFKEAAEPIVNKFLSNISAGAQANLKQTMDLMAALPQSRVSDARNRIVSTARRLIKEGIIAKP